MKERMILAPGLNGSELTRSLALHGVNCIGLRICGAAELARLALMRSGIAIAEDFVSAKEEAAIVAEAAAGEPYFKRATFSDLQDLSAALRRMRMLAASADEAGELERSLAQGVFQEKNAALCRVYRKYRDILSRRNAVDAVSLIRRAAEKSRAIGADFLTLKEYPLTPLETRLLERVSGGAFAEAGLRELFGAEEGKLCVAGIKNCFGAPNEVEAILEEVYSGGQPDRCTVAVTDGTVYGQLFFDYALQYELPITFGCGIPIVNANPARLAALYCRWSAGGFFDSAALREMLTSKAFDREKLFARLPARDESFRTDRFLEVLGGLRLSSDAGTNARRMEDFRKAAAEEAALGGKGAGLEGKQAFIPHLEVMAEELALPPEEFIFKYAYIRRDGDTNAGKLLTALDLAAAGAIYGELKVSCGAGAGQKAEDVIPNILRRNVCTQRSEAGKLHVAGIEGALAAVREELYVAGLSASCFPGSPRENYLLLDDDLRHFGPGAEMFTADGQVLRKRQGLLTLVRLASALGARVSVSYAGLNVAELKKDNPSSLIYELFREEHGGAATAEELEREIRKVGYFEPAVSASRLVGSAYAAGRKILPEAPADAQAEPVPWHLENAWSPTALDTFFACPRHFMLKYLLRIPEPEDEDPFEVISAADTGTLAHSLMEALGSGQAMDAEAFRELSAAYFDRFLREHPPLIAANAAAERERFLDMMETAYEMDPRREVVLQEEDICCTHESGVRIHGFPDRIEKLDDGTCLIVDFKSGRNLKHRQDDIATCLQVLIYAYLAEQMGLRVSGGEYRYLRLGETVTCRFDEEMKRQLSERLAQFRTCMQSGCFPAAEASGDREDPCRYCKYEAVCGKPAGTADAEEGGAE